MLKKLIYNGRNIPVPVPVKTLEDALTWVCDTLMKPDDVITRIVCNGLEVTDDFNPNLPLNTESKLDVRADSPSELSAQTLDAICSLSTIMFRGLKPIAVACWQALPAETPQDTPAIQDDLALIVELIENSLALVPTYLDVAPLTTIAQTLDLLQKALATCFGTNDWKQYARLLLNKLEPALQELIEHSSSLQTALFSDISEKALQRV